MTRREFYKKVHPKILEVLDEYCKDGDAAVENSFEICCLKEIDYRLDINADDEEDDIPAFDGMSPEFFVLTFRQMVYDWDGMADLLAGGDAAFIMYTEVVKAICNDWEEHKKGQHEKEDEAYTAG